MVFLRSVRTDICPPGQQGFDGGILIGWKKYYKYFVPVSTGGSIFHRVSGILPNPGQVVVSTSTDIVVPLPLTRKRRPTTSSTDEARRLAKNPAHQNTGSLARR